MSHKNTAILDADKINTRWFVMQQLLLMALLLMVLLPTTWYALYVLLPLVLVWRAIKQQWLHLDKAFAAFSTVFVVAFQLLTQQTSEQAIALPSELLFLMVGVFILQFLSFVFYQRVCQFSVFKPNMATKPLILNIVLLAMISGLILGFEQVVLNYPLSLSALLLALIVLLISTQLKVILYRTKRIQ